MVNEFESKRNEAVVALFKEQLRHLPGDTEKISGLLCCKNIIKNITILQHNNLLTNMDPYCV
jgi:hypothetical protein